MKQIRTLVLAALVGTAAVNSTAQVGGIAGGFCGTEPPLGMNLMWILYSDSSLRITGSGEMKGYFSAIEPNRPWENYLNQIKTVIIGDSVTSIGSSAFLPFLYPSIISSVTIGNSVTKIGNGAFRWCDRLTSIVFPNSVTIIEGCAFQGCNSLITVTIPNGVTRIQSQTFQGCSNLTDVVIGNGITMIECLAFNDCINLSSLTIHAVTPPILDLCSSPYGIGVFYDVPTDILVYVPCGSISAYQDSAGWSDFKKYIGIVDTVFIVDTACHNTIYSGNGFNIPAVAGTYYSNATCDTVIALTLALHVPPAPTVYSAMICEGEIYQKNGFNESETGIYYDTLKTIHGCDSVVILDLYVFLIDTILIFDTINSGETYNKNGFSASQTGIYIQELQNIYNCDSTVILNLIVDGVGIKEIAGQARNDVQGVEVYSAVGQLLLSLKSYLSLKQSLETLPQGIYIIRIKTNNGILTKKIIK